MLTSLLLAMTDGVQSLPPDDDFSPAVCFVALCFFAACLVLVGIGVAIGLVGAAGVAALVAFGIVSSSAVVALWQRRFSAGLRALHYQLCAAAALPGGVCLLWLGSGFFGLHLRHRHVLLVGALAGVAAGLLLAGVLDRLGRFALRRLLPTNRPPPRVPTAPVERYPL